MIKNWKMFSENVEDDNIFETIEGQLLWLRENNYTIYLKQAKDVTDHYASVSNYWMPYSDDIKSYYSSDRQLTDKIIYCIDIKVNTYYRSIVLDGVEDNVETIVEYLELNGYEAYYEFLILDRNYVAKMFYSRTLSLYNSLKGPSILKTLRIKFKEK